MSPDGKDSGPLTLKIIDKDKVDYQRRIEPEELVCYLPSSCLSEVEAVALAQNIPFSLEVIKELLTPERDRILIPGCNISLEQLVEIYPERFQAIPKVIRTSSLFSKPIGSRWFLMTREINGKNYRKSRGQFFSTKEELPLVSEFIYSILITELVTGIDFPRPNTYFQCLDDKGKPTSWTVVGVFDRKFCFADKDTSTARCPLSRRLGVD